MRYKSRITLSGLVLKHCQYSMHQQASTIKKSQVTEANGEQLLQALINCNFVILKARRIKSTQTKFTEKLNNSPCLLLLLVLQYFLLGQ